MIVGVGGANSGCSGTGGVVGGVDSGVLGVAKYAAGIPFGAVGQGGGGCAWAAADGPIMTSLRGNKVVTHGDFGGDVVLDLPLAGCFFGIAGGGGGGGCGPFRTGICFGIDATRIRFRSLPRGCMGGWFWLVGGPRGCLGPIWTALANCGGGCDGWFGPFVFGFALPPFASASTTGCTPSIVRDRAHNN